VFRGLADGAMSELKRLEDLGRTYSAEGMGAANQLAIAQQQSDQTLGEAFGPITAATSNRTETREFGFSLSQ